MPYPLSLISHLCLIIVTMKLSLFSELIGSTVILVI